ncbi:hypothetical protein H2204_015568 [Knufia peltigerae]|uniref:Uncharacterized protein n=1 Tax=Knufia peltigerae TaxID=1002370 RepID=A0AA38X9I2_9EURO|nr:hypothetical protein H2204_015568 [Knufia peltigerae]
MSRAEEATESDCPTPVATHGLASANLEVGTRHQNSHSSQLAGGALPLTATDGHFNNNNRGAGPSRVKLTDTILKKFQSGQDQITKIKKGKTAKRKRTKVPIDPSHPDGSQEEPTDTSYQDTSQEDPTDTSYQDTLQEDPIENVIMRIDAMRLGDDQKGQNISETILKTLEGGFIELHDGVRRTKWLSWYFAGCFSLCQHKMGLRPANKRLDHRADGVQVLHRIVNRMIQLKGIPGLMMLCAAAGNILEPTPSDRSELKKIEKGFYFYHAGRISGPEKVEFCRQVAEELCKSELSALPQAQRIPCPTVWISHFLPDVSHKEACRLLEIPELGRIPLKTVLIDLRNGHSMPEQTYPYSFLEAEWKKHSSGKSLPSQEEEAPQIEAPLPTERAESPNVPGGEAEAEEQMDDASVSAPTEIPSGYDASDSEPEERRSKWCRVEGACRDIAADIEHVNPESSFSQALTPGRDGADEFTNDQPTADNLIPHELRPFAPNAFADCGERHSGHHAGDLHGLGSTAQDLMGHESCRGNDVPGILRDFEHEHRSLDMSLLQNDNGGSSSVPSGRYAVDNTTLPELPNEVDFDPPGQDQLWERHDENGDADSTYIISRWDAWIDYSEDLNFSGYSLPLPDSFESL